MRISDWSSDVCSSDFPQEDAGDQRLGFLVPMRLAGFAGSVIDQRVGQRHRVVGEIEAGRVKTSERVERGPRRTNWGQAGNAEREIGRWACRVGVCKYV